MNIFELQDHTVVYISHSMKIETLPKLVTRVMKVFSLTFFTLIFDRATAFTSTSVSGNSRMPMTFAYQNEPKEIPTERMSAIVRMRNADREPIIEKIPDNAASILEETLRTLYSHRITHQVRYNKAAKTMQESLDDWAVLKIHEHARRRSQQLEEEIVLVKQCISAMRTPKTLSKLMIKKIQLLLEVDFKDPNHALPSLDGTSSVRTKQATPTKARQPTIRRTPFTEGRTRRMPAFALA